MSDSQEVLYPRAAARRFNVTTRTIHRWARQGLLPALKTPSGRLCFRLQDIEQALVPVATKGGNDES